MQFLPIRNVTLLIDVGNMAIDRSDTDAEALADKSRREAICQESYNLRLPPGEKIRLLEGLERSRHGVRPQQ